MLPPRRTLSKSFAKSGFWTARCQVLSGSQPVVLKPSRCFLLLSAKTQRLTLTRLSELTQRPLIRPSIFGSCRRVDLRTVWIECSCAPALREVLGEPAHGLRRINVSPLKRPLAASLPFALSRFAVGQWDSGWDIFFRLIYQRSLARPTCPTKKH